MGAGLDINFTVFNSVVVNTSANSAVQITLDQTSDSEVGFGVSESLLVGRLGVGHRVGKSL